MVDYKQEDVWLVIITGPQGQSLTSAVANGYWGVFMVCAQWAGIQGYMIKGLKDSGKKKTKNQDDVFHLCAPLTIHSQRRIGVDHISWRETSIDPSLLVSKF